MWARTIHSLKISAFIVVAAFAPLFSHAAVQNRVAGINSNNRVPLPNTIPGRARRATDMGAAPANRVLHSVTLRFSMTPDQQAALAQLLLDQQNSNSPQYHQWLTPEQFGAQFGLSGSDLAQVSAWLTAQGLTITGTSPSNNFISVSGTVAQVQQAFGTSIHSLMANGQQHIANLTDPVLPTAIASVVSTITGLNDFHPRARIRPNTVKPNFTSSQTGNHYVAPGDFYTIYDVNPLLSAGINGTGISIAVMGQVDISTSDIAAFRAASGLPASTPTVRLFGTDPGSPTGSCLSATPPSNCVVTASDLSEAQIDTEWAGAIAPSANVIFVNSTDVIDVSLMNAITSNVAPIISISYGACEDTTGRNGFTTQQTTSMDQLFQQANAQGQTIVSASGDAGATDCDGDAGNYPASLGLSVDFPASSPHVTGMGGTMFNDGTATGATSFWAASDGPYNGSAIGYIPELPWNETTATTGLGAGGGGASTFFPKPSWQSGTGVPADGARDVPDISFNAASAHDGYLYCAIGSCVTGFRYTDNSLTEAGGTSFGAPTFSGVLALIEQKTGSRLGNINPTLYALANSSYYNNAFHDITSGNNNSPCTSGTIGCPAGTTSIGYTAGVGYDQATGWGSLDIFNFVNEWALVTPLGGGATSGNSSVVSVTAAPSTTVTAGAAITLTANVASGLSGLATSPTGTVSFLVDNTAASNGTGLTLSSGTYSYLLATSSLTAGTHTVTVNYFGDSVFAASSSTLTLNITSATAADFTITSSASTVTATSGAASSPATFTVTPVNGFTGSVAFTATLPASLAATGSFTVSPVVITTAAGSTVFTLATTKTTTQTTTVLPNLHAAQQPPAVPAVQMHLFAAGGGVAIAGLLFFGLPRRRRFASLLGVFLSIAALSTIGCSNSVSAGSSSGSTTGGGSTPTTPTTPTTTTTTTTTPASPGTYTIAVTATSAGITHTSNVTLVVH
jgi:subtilase family serine protease